MTYLMRIDPNMTVEQAQRILASNVADLSRLRPKARAAREVLIREIEKEITQMQAPYPFCHHPEKCTDGRCAAEFCCND